jgi:hypothetical protein
MNIIHVTIPVILILLMSFMPKISAFFIVKENADVAEEKI